MRVTSCRICSGTSLAPVLDLGAMPTVNYFSSDAERLAKEPRYLLRLALCQGCGLVMLDEVVPPETLFREYHYLTSASLPLIEHFAGLASECQEHGWVTHGTKVLDIGANDGTLLRQFERIGARPLGVDPAWNAVERAERSGIRVLPMFFDEAAANEIAPRFGMFEVITCTNVFAHTHAVTSFLAGIKRLLTPGGVVIMEFAHLLDIVVKGQFDCIYHEHVSYFSLRPLERLSRACGFEIVDARKVLTQGGSLRIYARPSSQAGAVKSARMEAISAEEEEHQIHDLARLRRFADDVDQFRRDLRLLVSDVRQRGLKIVGLGAPAKAVVLLNYCGIGPQDLAYIVDSTELKQGRYLPGTHIPVRSEQALAQDESPADYFLLLAWNFQDAILKKVESYRAAGARVIVPFPNLRVI
jgi:2-polyprenyl-3-methyl-5-hydroxy-6-metoxy-1,4-benzoquinol methylase